MTKEELIKFLESFGEDIQIITYNDISGVCDIRPSYHVASESQVADLKYNKIETITEGDGFIVI